MPYTKQTVLVIYYFVIISYLTSYYFYTSYFSNKLEGFGSVSGSMIQIATKI